MAAPRIKAAGLQARPGYIPDMRRLLPFILLFAALLICILVWVRAAPVAVADWHVSPASAASPSGAEVQIVGDKAPAFAAPPEKLVSVLVEIAASKRRLRILANTASPHRITIEVRSKWLGFPDYMTFEAVPQANGTRIEVLARSRFAGYDWGVNSARTAHWIDQVREALR